MKWILSRLLILLPNAFNPEFQRAPAAATIPSDESEVKNTKIVSMAISIYV
jgi:hypothetical protein